MLGYERRERESREMEGIKKFRWALMWTFTRGIQCRCQPTAGNMRMEKPIKDIHGLLLLSLLFTTHFLTMSISLLSLSLKPCKTRYSPIFLKVQFLLLVAYY